MDAIKYKAQYDSYCETTERALTALLDKHMMHSDVLDAMRYSLLGGGKRVRAVLCLAAYAACGGPTADLHNAAMPAACAIEMVHAYSLIHDDLPCMDDDDMRRGKPACHKQFGEATALLAGDALLTCAFEALGGCADAETAITCVRTLAVAAGYVGMIRGQELDLAAETHAISLDALGEVHAHKTGALIRAAARMGALAAKADAISLAALDTYASEIGLVFQIVDDILDCTSDTAALGKPVGSDAQQNKSTYPRLIGLDASRDAAHAHTQTALDALQATFPADARAFLEALAQHLLTRIN